VAEFPLFLRQHHPVVKQLLTYIILLPVFVSFMAYTCGIHLYFELQLHDIKKENYVADREDHEHELVQLEIPLDEITWIHAHEIYWNGEMYDITEDEIKGNMLHCKAYHDNEEKELTEKYARHNTSDHPGNSEKDRGGKVIHPFIVMEGCEMIIFSDRFILQQENDPLYHSDYAIACFQPPKV